MDKNIVARNILIHRQLKSLAEIFFDRRLPVVVLKGAALVECMPEYAGERFMDDVDLLIRPRDLSLARRVLTAAGYRPVPHDPWAYAAPGKPAYIDLCDHLWYHSPKETETLWQNALKYPMTTLGPSMHHLPPDELYIHTLAHAAVHHASREKSWMRDLVVIKRNWKGEIDEKLVREKLSRYGLTEAAAFYAEGMNSGHGVLKWFYGRLVENKIPRRGYLLRFLFLPFKKKLPYLLYTLFPSTDFLVYRYDLKNRAAAHLFRFLRPLLLFVKIFRHK